MSDALAEIKAHYDHIAEVFPKFDLAAFRTCFHMPCQLTTPDAVIAITDDDTFTQVFGGMMATLRDQGLTRSEVERMHVRLLGETTALASIVWVRHAGEAVLERLGATYTLVRRDGEWLVAALIAHSADEVKPLD